MSAQTGGKMNRLELIRAYVQQLTGQSLEFFSPQPFSPDQVQRALWPLNARFRPHMAQIGSVAYAATFEAEADAAVQALVLDDDDWSGVSPGAWRVLLERHVQLLFVAQQLASSGQPMTQVPARLAEQNQARVAIAALLHSMKLPLQPADRAGFDLPAGGLPESSLRRH